MSGTCFLNTIWNLTTNGERKSLIKIGLGMGNIQRTDWPFNYIMKINKEEQIFHLFRDSVTILEGSLMAFKMLLTMSTQQTAEPSVLFFECVPNGRSNFGLILHCYRRTSLCFFKSCFSTCFTITESLIRALNPNGG